jgi:undecaprenyl-diphosphatase
MTIIQAIILGLVQGLTEFLPVSSSGHLVLMQKFLGISEGGLTFEVLVHFGTLVAVFIVYWREIFDLIKNPMQKMTYLIIVGAIPTALMGFIFKPYFEKLFESIIAVGISLVITGCILWISDNHLGGLKNEKNTSWFDVLIIGFAQGLAITPGISRMGLTVSAGLMRGLTREMAAKYSFLLSIPVIFGANLLEFKDAFSSGLQLTGNLPYIIGTLVAAVSGVFAIKVLLKVLKNGKLRYFSYYVWILGIIIILQQIIS